MQTSDKKFLGVRTVLNAAKGILHETNTDFT